MSQQYASNTDAENNYAQTTEAEEKETAYNNDNDDELR